MATCHFLLVVCSRLTTNLSCTVSDILSIISQNLQKSRDPEHIPYGYSIMRALELLSINRCTKVELPSVTTSKDTIRSPKLDNGQMTLTTPIRG